jgi:thiol-disulfide isomerase/thioredoxin
MKLILKIPVLLFVIALFACNSGDKNAVVKLNIKNNKAKQAVYLDVIELDGEPITLDTAMAGIGTSTLELKAGTVNPSVICRVRFQQDQLFFLVIPDQSSINLDIDVDNSQTYTTNSVGSNSFKTMVLHFNELLGGIDALKAAIDAKGEVMDSNRVEMETKFRSTLEEAGNYLLAYADSTKTPAIALYAVGMTQNIVAADKVLVVMDRLSKRFSDISSVVRITNKFKSTVAPSQENGLVGKEAPLFELPGVDGQNVALKSFRGKYVLVDFWASWCKPCRQENPNVVAAYNKYSSKNFTILGVSLDKEKEPWLKAINDDQLFWNHASDLKYWNSAVVPMYAIEGIPFNVLLDPNGIVIAKDLRGEELHKKLAEVLQ